MTQDEQIYNLKNLVIEKDHQIMNLTARNANQRETIQGHYSKIALAGHNPLIDGLDGLIDELNKLRASKEELIKEIISERDQITKPSALSNMLPENLSKYGKGFNAGVGMVLNLLKCK